MQVVDEDDGDKDSDDDIEDDVGSTLFWDIRFLFLFSLMLVGGCNRNFFGSPGSTTMRLDLSNGALARAESESGSNWESTVLERSIFWVLSSSSTSDESSSFIDALEVSSVMSLLLLLLS